jgi:hypothetical protein
MPATVTDQLMTLVQEIRLQQLPAPVNTPTSLREVRVQLSRPGGLTGLPVADSLTVAQVQSQPVALDALTKNVRFDVTDVNAINQVTRSTKLRGGQPIASVSGQVDKVTLGDTGQPGLPGTLGNSAGTIPVVVPVTTPVALDVSVDVRWSFRNEAGEVTFDVDWQVGPPVDANGTPTGSPTSQGRGGEVTPPSSAALQILHVGLPVLFVERASNLDSRRHRFVHASVRLFAKSAAIPTESFTTPWIDLPRLEVQLPVVEVPTLLTLFTESSFQGAASAIVPGDSALLDKASLVPTLQQLIPVIQGLANPQAGAFPPPLTSLSGVAAKINQLISLLSATGVAFARTTEIKNLRYTTLNQTTPTAAPATTVENQYSSLILIGPPGRRVRLFNARDFIDAEGQMYATCGSDFCVLIQTLHHANPASDPPGRVTVVSQPRGQRAANAITTFGDEVSSLRFE